MYFWKNEKVKKNAKLEGQERRRKQNQLYVNATFHAPRCFHVFTLILIMVQLDLIIMIASLLANKNPLSRANISFIFLTFFLLLLLNENPFSRANQHSKKEYLDI